MRLEEMKINPRKDKTLRQIYGKEKGDKMTEEINSRKRCKDCGQILGKSHYCKGPIVISHCKKCGQFLKEGHKCPEVNPFFGKHHSDSTKQIYKELYSGKTFEERFGKEKTKIIKEKISKNIKGKFALEKHPNWLGGLSFEPYTPEFNNNFKNSIRKRDNQVCMNCGIHREKLNKSLEVHHINYDKKMTIPENCICLCPKCHLITNGNRKYWKEYYQKKLARLYNYKYSNGEIILNLTSEDKQ